MSGLRQFFVVEATDYLDRLEALVEPGKPGDFAASDATRLCRALRGAARLSQEEAIRRIAESMERGAKAVRSGKLEWDDAVRDAFVRSIDAVRSLLRGDEGAEAGDGDGGAEAIHSAWSGLLPGRPEVRDPGAASVTGELSGYAVSELGSIQEALAATADAVEDDEGDVRGAAEGVLEALGPLAGAAWLDRFPGMEEFVAEVEDVMGRLAARGGASGDGWADFARSAAAAAGELAGATESDSGEAPESVTGLRRRGRELLEGATPGGASQEGDVVPIEELFFDGPEDDVVPHRREEELPVEVRNFFRIEATSLVDRAEELVNAVRRGEGRAARELAEACAELSRIFASFQFTGAAGVARSLASRAREAPGGKAAARIAAAMPDVRALVEEIDDPRRVDERVRRIRDLLEVEEATPADAPVEADAGAEVEAGTEPGVETEPRSTVPIRDLLYRGEAALARAEELAPEVEQCLGAGDVDGLRGHLEEIFDLIVAARKGPERG